MTADIIDCLSNTNVHILLYADDTKIYSVVNCDEERRSVQLIIDRLCKWLVNNKLPLNHSKTSNVTYFKNKLNYDSYYYIGDTRTAHENSVKDLGVIFDNQVNFKAHCMTGIGYRFCQQRRLTLCTKNLQHTSGHLSSIAQLCCLTTAEFWIMKLKFF